MKRATPYDEKFFVKFVNTSESSARVIVPAILALVNPASVVDVGCGEGVWLTIFAEHGVPRILGVDGDYV